MNLTTPRLVLRDIEESDFDALLELYNDSQGRQYEQSSNVIYTAEDIQQRMRWTLADQKADPRMRFRFALTIRPDPYMHGWITLQPMNSSIREWEVGWTVHRSLWGHGYATEGARAVMHFAFEDLKAHRLVAFCHKDNAASERVMQKLGMQYEGCTRSTRWINGAWTDELVYAVLEGEFKLSY